MTVSGKSKTGVSRVAGYLGALLCAAGLSLPAGKVQAQTPFYHATALELAGPPGTLIRSEPMMFAPAGAQAYRVWEEDSCSMRPRTLRHQRKRRLARRARWHWPLRAPLTAAEVVTRARAIAVPA
jgi:hypothetical protein